MALCLSRVETVLSLQQLLPIDAADPCPDCPVADVAKGGCLPLVSFSSGRGFQAKRVRSFGDMQVVPDVDDLGCVSDGSSLVALHAAARDLHVYTAVFMCIGRERMLWCT